MGRAGLSRADIPFLRACVLESVRLWPTTPMILRQTTHATEWETGLLPARAGVMIYAPFFHRDGERLAQADRFAPELWLEGHEALVWPLIPFSAGPAVCAGRDLVLLVGSVMLAALLDGRQVRLKPPHHRLSQAEPLPATLNPYGLRFELSQNRVLINPVPGP